MKCANHSEREPVTTCGLCGESFCDECLVSLGDRCYCKRCLSEKVGGPGDAEEHERVMVSGEKKSRLWAFVFSVAPGVGYLYLGLMNKGLQTMLLFFGSIFVAGFIGFEEIMALVAPVVVFYSIFDTQQLVKSMNAGIPVEDKQFFDFKKIPYTHNWIGYALIVTGFLALMHNMPFYFPFWPVLRQMVPPLLIIGLGIAILYRNTRKVS